LARDDISRNTSVREVTYVYITIPSLHVESETIFSIK